MSVITVKNAPDKFIRKYGNTIDLNEYLILKKSSNPLNLITQVKELYYDKNNNSYGPFEGEEAISFLKLLDYENSLS